MKNRTEVLLTLKLEAEKAERAYYTALGRAQEAGAAAKANAAANGKKSFDAEPWLTKRYHRARRQLAAAYTAQRNARVAYDVVAGPAPAKETFEIYGFSAAACRLILAAYRRENLDK